MLLNRSTASHPTTAARAALRTTDTGIEETEGKKKKKIDRPKNSGIGDTFARKGGGGGSHVTATLSLQHVCRSHPSIWERVSVCVCVLEVRKKKKLSLSLGSAR